MEVTKGRPAPLWFPPVVLGLALVSSTIFLSVGISVSHFSGPATLSRLTPFLLLMDEIGLWVFFVGGAAFAAHTYWREPFFALIGWHLRPLVDVPVGIVAGVVSQLVIVPLLYLPFEAINPSLSRSLSKPAQSIVGIGHGEGLIVIAFVLVIGAPVCEEIFFRGLTLAVLRDRLGRFGPVLRATLAILGSALLFALAHFEPLQFAGLFAVGCVFGGLMWRTKRLGTSIIAHATFNLVALLALVHVH
ncbi:type II CAAX endopeptidase family protein [Ferrimicrobium sp.]|uniref:CPBP family intramembrane glutamic endopeptidase n=1 Tax=Ferrimicrobium sp. TaxID=2926050 RepID=UPI00261C407B|nr:type II CAAX endopeptidase family protein [Ferrimicrobium sp.]